MSSVELDLRRDVRSVYCIGRNYRAHAAELHNPVPEQPLVFLKSAGALRPLSGGAVAFAEETFDHELELLVWLGSDVPLHGQAGWEAVRAVGLGLDLTRRAEQSALKQIGHPWTTAKSFAGAGIVAPLVPLDAVASRDDIDLSLRVNGSLRQQGRTGDMLFPVPELLRYLASFVQLSAGDLLFTGTPEGVGPLRVGDELELSSQQLGRFVGTL